MRLLICLIHKNWFYLFKKNNQSVHSSSFFLCLLKTAISFKIQASLGAMNLFNYELLNLDYSSDSLLKSYEE